MKNCSSRIFKHQIGPNGHVQAAEHRILELLRHLALEKVRSCFSVLCSTLFYKSISQTNRHTLDTLSRAPKFCKQQIVPLAQRVARGATARRFYNILLKCGAILKRAIDRASSGKDDLRVLDKAIEDCARLVGPMRSMFATEHPMMKEAKTLRFKLREWMELTEIYRKLKNKDPSANYGEFTDAVKRGTKILDVPHTSEMEGCTRRARIFLITVSAST